MINNTIAIHRLLRLVSASIVLSLSVTLCQAQRVSQYDRGTPPQHVAGVSAIGSYLSDDLGTINLANGALNMKLPLGQAGGRGFWLPISLNYSSKVWSVSGDTDFATDTVQRTVAGAVYGQAQNDVDFFCRLTPGWSYGAVPFLRAQGVHIRPFVGSSCDYHYALVKLTLVMPDRGEIELRDDSFDGEPRPAQTTGSCLARDANRGTRWHATDGSGTIFVSDSASSGVSFGDLRGTIITADGMRYHFANWDYPGSIQDTRQIHNLARCDLITDRNGNFVQITNSTNNLKTIQFTDQLGRVTTVQKNTPDPDNLSGPTLALLVTLPGYQGQPRYYKVRTATMNLHYRSDQNPPQGTAVIVGDHSPGFFDYSWQGPHISLFPSSEGLLNAQMDTQVVVTQLVLPDGRTMNFNYNQFGEVSEVQLFTGAKIQYDYAPAATLPAGNTLEQETRAQLNSVSLIDRAVVARRKYQPNTTDPESSWSYTYGSLTPSNSMTAAPATEITCTSSSGQLLHERHFFLPAGRYFDGIDIGMKGVDGTHYTLWSTGLEFRSEVLDSNGTTVLAAAETDWSQRVGVAWTGGYIAFVMEQQEQPANDNRTTESRRFLDDGSMARVHPSYDDLGPYPRANNPKTVDEYDFGGSLKRHSETTYSGAYVSDSTHILRLPLQASTYDVANGTLFAQSTFEYDIYTSDGDHAPLQSYSPDAFNHASGYGSTYTTRGNATRIARRIDGVTSVNSYPRYDVLGNVVSVKDSRGAVETISFVDNFGNGASPDSGSIGTFGATYALPTLITSPSPNSGEPTQTARTQFDFSTGLATGFKARNGTITQTLYNDPFDRPTQIKSGLGTTVENHTAIHYAPASVSGVNLTNNDALTSKDQADLDDGKLRSWTKTDGFGRTLESWSHAPDQLDQGNPFSGDIVVQTNYDGLGRARQTSNPFRPALSTESAQLTTTAYDLAGRVITVTTPDNAVVSTAYNGPRVLVTDQAGKQRISKTDGLGRLTDVWEIRSADTVTGTEAVTFPNHTEVTAGYRSRYSYDALDDLTQVTQQIGTTGTTQTRTFAYDGLKRLTSAVNPESGTVSYTYDENSNLKTKLDARSITTTFEYDALNRVNSRTYTSDPQNTPAVAYKYDGQPLPTGAPGTSLLDRGFSIGRLVAVTYGGTSAGNYTGYDRLGRANVSVQQTDSQNYRFTYGYSLSSAMTSEVYPSGRTISSVYDEAGRLTEVNGQKVPESNKTYASQFGYAAHGAVSAMLLGNGKWEHTSFNSRLQPLQIGLGISSTDSSTMKLDYTYNTPGLANNNGNVLTQAITVGATVMNQSYGYDALNRLSSASETGAWTQTYDYDRYGNRAVRAGSLMPAARQTPTSNSPSDLPVLFNQGNNRIIATSEYGYDAAGNLTSMPDKLQGQPADTMTYDAENRQKTFNGTVGQYVYDGDGRRVKKIDGTGTTVFVYNAGGQLIAEYHSGRLKRSLQQCLCAAFSRRSRQTP